MWREWVGNVLLGLALGLAIACMVKYLWSDPPNIVIDCGEGVIIEVPTQKTPLIIMMNGLKNMT